MIALVSPHAGYAFSGKAAAAGFKLLRGQSIRRVVLLAVAHRVPFEGASIAGVTHYDTPLGLIELDHAAVARLRRSRVAVIPFPSPLFRPCTRTSQGRFRSPS